MRSLYQDTRALIVRPGIIIRVHTGEGMEEGAKVSCLGQRLALLVVFRVWEAVS